MKPTDTQHINMSEITDTVTNGYQYIIVHSDALNIEIPMEKCAILDNATNKPTGNFLTITDINDILGDKFVPTLGYLADGYYLVHWCFDERLINGLYEQQYIKQLFSANGFQNLRDLNNDGINDSTVEMIDYATALADKTKKYYMIVSAREIHKVPKYKKPEPTYKV